MTALLGLVVGFVALTVAADQLVLGASRLAARLGVTPAVVGVVIVGFGTSAPELVVCGIAAGRGHPALGIGDLVGANVANLTLVLGIAGLRGSLAVSSPVLTRDVPVAILSMIVFAVALSGGLTVVDAALLTGFLAVALVVLVRAEHPHLTSPPTPTAGRLPWEATRTAAALAGALAGAWLLVGSGVRLAHLLGVPQAVIGFTLVAFGTSLPELVTAVAAQRRRETDLLVGSLLGSNLLNSAAGGAVVGFVGSGNPAVPLAEIVYMVGVGLVAWGLLATGSRLTRWEAAALVVAYGVAVPLLFT